MQPTPVQGQTLNSLSPRAQLSRGKGVTRGSFCPLSRTWGQAQGSQLFDVPLMTSTRNSPVCWGCTFVLFPFLPLPVNRWMGWRDPYTGLSHTHLPEAVYSGIWMCKWEPRVLCLKPSPAQGRLNCVTSPVHVSFPVFEYQTGVRSCYFLFRCCWRVSCSSSIYWCKILGKLPPGWWRKWKTGLIMDVKNAWTICFIPEMTWWSYRRTNTGKRFGGWVLLSCYTHFVWE